jgi:hypothetical protein
MEFDTLSPEILAPRPPRWPLVAVAGCVAMAAYWELTVGAQSGAGTALLLFMLCIGLAKAASVASGVIALATGIEAIGRRPSLARSRAPRLIVGIYGGAVVGLGILVLSMGEVAGLLLVMPGGGVVALALWGRQAPWSLRGSMIALALVMVGFELPAEVGWVTMSWTSSEQQANRNVDFETSCESTDWGEKATVASLTRRIAIRSKLTGNVGALAAVGPEVRRAPGTLVIDVAGEIDSGDPWCWLPLYKEASFETTLTFKARVSDVGEGESSASCDVSGTIHLTVDRMVTGLSSCRAVRKDLAKAATDQLMTVARGLAK